MVTAFSDAEVVRASVHLGIVDYLLKPFRVERLRQSLALFRRRVAMLAGPDLDQRDVDRICSDGPRAQRWLPREITEDRLAEIELALASFARPVTATEVAARSRVSRVTARRYLEYLVTIEQARTGMVATGPGRPSKTYRPADDAAARAVRADGSGALAT